MIGANIGKQVRDMSREGITINDAAHQWVGSFNSFPYGMIERLMETNIDEWNEVTMPSKYNRVYVYEAGEYGEIKDIIDDEYIIELDNGDEITCPRDEFEDADRDSYLPMWGTLWQFDDMCDDWWLKEDNGIKLMSECGFRIYEHEEWGYFFGIDGAGYDFYEQHWIPLYKARGLQWHDSKTEAKEVI